MATTAVSPASCPVPTDLFEVLEWEHERILEALCVLDALAGRFTGGRQPPKSDLAAVVTFLQRFADRCHHAKEEDVLFPALERAGLPREGGPVAVMLQEHEQGRLLLSQIAVADGGDLGPDLDAARSYVALLRDHILKENEVLFEMGRSLLEASAEEGLVALAATFETRSLEPGEKDRLLYELARLKAEYL